MLIALGASAAVFLAWRVFRPTQESLPYLRTLADVLLPYECHRGHTFNAPGQVGSMACPICQTPAYPRTTYECPIHGEHEVEVEFALTSDGVEEVVRLRLPGGEWSAVERELRCPSCQSPLFRPRHEDLSHLGQLRPKAKPGERPPPREAPSTKDRRGQQAP